MKKKNTWVPILIVTAAILVVLAVVICFVLPIFQIRSFLNPEKQPMTTIPYELYLQSRFCEIPCGDDILAAWYLPAQFASEDYDQIEETDRTIIFSHNYESNKDMEEINALYLARGLLAEGYNVVMFDYSGSGTSTGAGYHLGVREAKELETVVRYVRETLGQDKISLLGWGFGAAAALMCEADVDAVIAESTYTDLPEYLRTNLNDWIDMPSFMNGYGIRLIEAQIGDLSAAKPLEAVRRQNGISYFFIDDANDVIFPSNAMTSLEAAARAAGHPTSLWTVKGAAHIMGYKTEPENYISRIDEFLDGVYAE